MPVAVISVHVRYRLSMGQATAKPTQMLGGYFPARKRSQQNSTSLVLQIKEFSKNTRNMCKLHHIAISVLDFDQYKMLFEKIGMTVKRITGEAPSRQLWFYEGIQLNEVNFAESGYSVDHIALESKDIGETVRIALENGCRFHPRGINWFVLPNGINIELIEQV